LVKAKLLFLFIALSTFHSSAWGSDPSGFQRSVDQLLQSRAGLEKFGYTSADVLEKRLSSFTRRLWEGKIHSSEKEESNLFHEDWEVDAYPWFAQKGISLLDTSDIQINDEDYPSTYQQGLPYVSMFDDRSFVAVWEDERNGDVDVFGQKLTFNGEPVGDNLELSQEDFPKDQLLPCAATVGDTAFVVVWVDEESFDVYGRRFDADLLPLGGAFQVNDEGIPSWVPSLSCGPDGGFVVAWVDVGSANDIRARRFDASGSPLGESFKVNEDKGTRPHISPSVSVGESGKFVVAWEDYRDLDANVYAQRFDSAGNKLGGNILVNSDSLDEDQYSPVVSVGKNDGFMVAWVDLRSGIQNVFARIFSSAGTPQTSLLRADTTSVSEPREDPWVGSDTTGRYAVVWTDYASSYPVIYTQRFDSLGQAVGSKLRTSDQEATGERHDATLSTAPSGAFVVGWMDRRNSNYDIYARTVTSLGFLQQESGPVNDDSSGANQMSPQITTTSDGGFIAVWEDFRNSNSDIYLKRYNPSGEPLGDDLRVNDDSGYNYQGLPDVACDESGNFVAVWEDAREGLDIYAQLFDNSGNVLGENFKVNADSETDLHNSPSCDRSPQGDFVVVWAAREGEVQNVYGRLFGSDGQPKDTCFKINDDEQEVDHLSPIVSMDSSGNFVVGWEDQRDGQDRIYLQRYDAFGIRRGDNFPLYAGKKDPSQSDPDLDLNQNGEFMVVWVESGQVGAQPYDTSASPIGTNIVVVDDPSSFPENPRVKVTDNGYFVVTWTDHRGEGSDIYVRTYLDGSPQGSGQPVNTDTAGALQTSASIDLWGNYLYSVWMDNRTPGNGFDIYFNAINFKQTAVQDEEEERHLPEEFTLYQNYPNPFNPDTRIEFTLPGGQSPRNVSLRIYNIRGQLVKTLMEEEKPPGDYQVIWDGRNDEEREVASGIYFYQLMVRDQMSTRRMLLLR
jgi:hypothetical protein